MKKYEKITISELSEITGVTSSSIRYYLNEGLLPTPLRKGVTKAYYNDEHIKKLKTIKELQTKKKLSIREIKNMLPNYNSDREKQQVNSRKDDIIKASIDLFREKGYDLININDIVNKTGISKSTFYLNYDSKESLFIDCAEEVFSNIDINLKEIENETDVIKRIMRRAVFFINECGHLIDMLHIARGSNGIILSEKRDKLNAVYANLAIPLMNDLDEGIKKGLFTPFNSKVIAYMMIGSAEYIISYLKGMSETEKNNMIEQSHHFFLDGIFKVKKSGK